MQRLQQLKEAVLSTEPFGWSLIGPKVEGFAYGGTLYTPSGSRLAPLTDHSLAMQYTPTGSLQPWHDAMQMLLAQKRTALDVVLAASFAAPLVRSTGQPGLLMSLYSLESGIGKTTAMKVGQAVWGDPVKAMQGLNDTQNAVLGKLGRLRSLPMFWDELKTEDDAEKLVNLFFTITRGSEKLRMKATTELRASGSWETLLVSASNESMVDYIIGKTRMTTAGIYRLFEFTVPPGSDGRIAVSDASRMVSAMNTNFGVAGQIYSQFLGTNFQRIDDEVAAEMVTVGDAVKVRPDERFWSALVAIVTLGARYANELGLATFDYDKLQEFMADQFFAMRKLKSEQSVDMTRGNNVANILVQFLRDHRARNTLITDTMWMGRGKPKIGSVKILGDTSRLTELKVHAAVNDKRLRISLSGLEEWMRKHSYQRHVFIDALRQSFGAIRRDGTLGAGTNMKSGTEVVLDIDLTNAAAKKYLQDFS
jgi:hypothetical protein